MKIAHFSYYYPKAAGIYETTREMTLAELELGHDARMIDTSWYTNKGVIPITSKLDRGVEIAPLTWSLEADLHVLHSIVPEQVRGKKPIVIVLHGAPEYCFYSELINHEKGDRGYSTLLAYARDPMFKRAVTLWKRHIGFWEPIFGDRMRYVDSCADFRDYTPEGPKLVFKTPGAPNIGFCDSWRITFAKDPFQICMGVYKYCKENPNAKLQLFAVPPGDKRDIVWDRLINTFKLTRNIFGEFYERYPDMPAAYRALDMIVTPVVDASRTIREALACGVPIIASPGCPFTPYTSDLSDPEDLARTISQVWKDLQENRERVRQECVNMAHKSFSLKRTGEQLVAIYNEVLKECSDAGSSKHEPSAP